MVRDWEELDAKLSRAGFVSDFAPAPMFWFSGKAHVLIHADGRDRVLFSIKAPAGAEYLRFALSADQFSLVDNRWQLT